MRLDVALGLCSPAASAEPAVVNPAVVKPAAEPDTDTGEGCAGDSPAEVRGCGFRITASKTVGGRGRGWGRGRGRGRGGLMRMTTSAADGYEDNKRRSIMAVQKLLPSGHEALVRSAAQGVKADDLCDVLLMALWELWQMTTWRLPPKAKAPRATKAKAPAHALPNP